MTPTLPATMRAAVLLGPERVEIREIELPRPGPGELLIEIGAALTCGTDVKVYRRGGHPRMLEAPTLFGHEMAGTVAAVGEGVSAFREGDRVVVANSAACGRCPACRGERENLCRDLVYLNGAFAEFLRVPARFVERSTHLIGAALPFEVAALTEPLACVLHGVEACRLDELPGPAEAIVYGAGPIGLLFIAVLAGQGHRVIAADPNPGRLEAARRLGATGCVQVKRGGQGRAGVVALTDNGEGAQLAVDCTGVPEAWENALASVRPGGLVNLFGGCAPGSAVHLDTHRVHYSELTVKGVYHHRPANVREALASLKAGKLPARLLLTGERPLDELVQALDSMSRREALKVVIRGG